MKYCMKSICMAGAMAGGFLLGGATAVLLMKCCKRHRVPCETEDETAETEVTCDEG